MVRHRRLDELDRLWGASAVRVPTVSFIVDGLDSDRIVLAIDPMRIGIRFGDFYSRRLVEDLGLAAGKGVVRASFAHYNTVADADRLIEGLEQALAGR